jgi:hypothetical protein
MASSRPVSKFCVRMNGRFVSIRYNKKHIKTRPKSNDEVAFCHSVGRQRVSNHKNQQSPCASVSFSRRWFYLLCGVSFGLRLRVREREKDANQKHSLPRDLSSQNYGNGPVH